MSLKNERMEAAGEVWQHEASMEAVARRKGDTPVSITACACEFDAWQFNLYTKVMQESIDKDHAPKSDLAALERQHEADYATISKQAADLAAVSKSAAELIKAANKRADEAERDARRYRWMRSCVNDHEKMARIEAYDDPKTEVEFDAAIDEAMRNG